GNIGSVLAERLLAQKFHVRVIGRSKERLQPLVQKGAEAWQGSLDDAEFLAGAFAGSAAAFTMIPPNPTAENFRAYQNQIGEATASAIKKAGLKQIVNLSSYGTQAVEGTGPIKGLRDNEERFNQLAGVDIVHL